MCTYLRIGIWAKQLGERTASWHLRGRPKEVVKSLVGQANPPVAVHVGQRDGQVIGHPGKKIAQVAGRALGSPAHDSIIPRLLDAAQASRVTQSLIDYSRRKEPFGFIWPMESSGIIAKAK